MNNKEKPTVAVLMSTYNGEKYLREQLDSVFSQNDVEVKLYVRDDGSKDATLSIIKEYAGKYPVIEIADGENVGPGESFMRLVYKYADEPDVDYFAFADQDDIWLEDKLSIAVQSIIDSGYKDAVLYSSNQYIYVDSENRGLHYKDRQTVEFIPHITKNTLAGCTFVFNKNLAGLLAHADRPEHRLIKYRLHDAWTVLVAIACGHVIYDESAHMLYRIHSENTVGIKGIPLKTRISRLQRFFVNRDDANLRMKTAGELLRLYPEIDDEKKRILNLYANYQDNVKSRMALAFNKEIRDNCAENPIVFTIKTLVNFV